MARAGRRLGAGLVAAALAAAGCGVPLPFAGAGEGAQRPAPPAPPWRAELGRDHPLAGRLWDPRAARFVAPSELRARARAARFVLLGERHDHPDHHRLQAWLVEHLGRAGTHRALAFEMIPQDEAPALGAAARESPGDPGAIARALDWEASGWPPFALYRPVLDAALATGLAPRAADLPAERAERVREDGLDALDPALRERLALDRPLPEPARLGLAAALRRGHCDALPEPALARLAQVQRARDAHLADALLRAANGRGAILVAGNGHVRRGRGVPVYLGRRRPADTVLALALLEVQAGEEAPGAYLREPGEPSTAPGRARPAVEPPFDLVWFTPRLDDRDPCERFRERLERLSEEMAPE